MRNRINRRWHRGIDYVRHHPVRFAFVTVVVTATISLFVLAWAVVVVGNATQSNREAAETNRRLIGQVRVLAGQGVQSHDVQCAVAADYQRRIAEAQAFLTKPPSTFAGFPVTEALIAQIANSKKNLEATYDAMIGSGLVCDRPTS